MGCFLVSDVVIRSVARPVDLDCSRVHPSTVAIQYRRGVSRCGGRAQNSIVRSMYDCTEYTQFVLLQRAQDRETMQEE